MGTGYKYTLSRFELGLTSREEEVEVVRVKDGQDGSVTITDKRGREHRLNVTDFRVAAIRKIQPGVKIIIKVVEVVDDVKIESK